MKKYYSIILTTLLIVLIIITQTGCGKVEPVTKTSYYLDTVCDITIYNMEDMSEVRAKEAIDKGFKVCSKYENLLSKTKKGSDIYKVNHSKGKAVKVDDETIKVVNKGIQYGDLSKGRFDITIGKVTDLWDFHSEKPKVPAEVDIKKALSAVSYKQIKIEGDTIALENPEGEIDLGGIAKGYIADRVADSLKEQGVTNAIVNLGGNIVAIGGKNLETSFNIGIERPYSDRTEIVGSVHMKNQTIVTSGIYERNFKVKDKIYHHILDVKTGYPVDSDVEAVTIVADIGRSVDCDGLSTTCLLLGVEKGKALIESLDGVEALFIDKNNKITYTSGMNFVPKK